MDAFDKYNIYGHKDGMKKLYTTEYGLETVREEVERLNDIDDGISYTFEHQNKCKPEEITHKNIA